MDFSALELALITVVLGFLIIIALKRISFLMKLPPGPWGLPFIGSIVHLNRNNVLLEFAKYKEKYGPIFSVGIGTANVIVINDYKLIHEALKLDVLNGRPDFQMWSITNDGVRNRGILMCDANATWNEQRRFALRNLRDFGFGKESMEGMLIHELQQLIKHIKKTTDKPICPRLLFNASVLNSLWLILTGHRFELDDTYFKNIIAMFTETMQRIYLVGYGLFLESGFKMLRRHVWDSSYKMRQEVLALMKAEVAEHEATYEDGLSRDFIDVYLGQRKAHSNSSFTDEEGLKNLVSVLKDLFLAGSETTSTTLYWTILYLTQNPQIQVKVQEEIDAVIGRNRLPSREDKPNLMYVEAVLNEVFRTASLVPTSVYHKVLEDTEFAGHFFPKDAIVLPNLYEAHHNVAYWKDPENFRPERFLNTTGTALIKHEPLMPFSTGKRVCLGETLARDTLFLFMVGLFQTFSFQLTPEWKTQKLTHDKPTFILAPKDFEVIITLRK